MAGHSSDNVADLLFVAELLAMRNITVSIFTLDYTLAPRVRFPRQLEEAMAAYRYLVEELGIEVERLAVLGESAGGHLVLSLLTNLHLQATGGAPSVPPKPPLPLPKPAMALLMSPWIDLLNRDPRA